VVKHIIAPGAGVPIEARPPVPTEEERHADKEAKREAKEKMRAVKKTIQSVEHQIGLAETLLKRTRKQFALHARLMGVNVEAGAGAGEGGKPADVATPSQ
jgi:small subunit ribosomal protein S17